MIDNMVQCTCPVHAGYGLPGIHSVHKDAGCRSHEKGCPARLWWLEQQAVAAIIETPKLSAKPSPDLEERLRRLTNTRAVMHRLITLADIELRILDDDIAACKQELGIGSELDDVHAGAGGGGVSEGRDVRYQYIPLESCEYCGCAYGTMHDENCPTQASDRPG